MPQAATPAGSPAVAAWWREPMMWLVVGGPLAVVLACVATAVVIARHPDPPLTLQERQELNKAEQYNPQQAPDALTPALKARNHAAQAGAQGTRDEPQP
ncbi:MAG: hypothetical protein HZB72_12820 [Burkholderiales bacterium]|nr:hypothetical protein [Burkholderiales bacterium]